MAFEPVKFVDSLTKGLIQAIYDFARLTFASAAIPFVTGTRHFWPAVMTIHRRLSSLTYLFVWILIAVSIVFESEGRKLFAATIGTEKPSDGTVLAMFATALMITLALDLGTRVGCHWLASDARRALYRTIAHLALGNFFFGVLLVWLLTPKGTGSLTHIIGMDFLHGSYFGMAYFYPKPFMLLFSLPLAVVIAKGLSVPRHWRSRLLVGVAASAALTFATAQLSGHAARVAFKFGGWVSPQKELQVKQRATRCVFSPDGIRLHGFLVVTGAPYYAFDPRIAGIQYQRGDAKFFAAIRSRQSSVALTSAGYTWVELAGDYDKKDTTRTVSAEENCILVLFEYPIEDDERPIEVVIRELVENAAD